MLRTLDRYIIRQFLGTFFYILIAIMLIAVVFDISEKTEDFAKMKASWHEIVLDYYVNFVIYYSNLFSGLLIFLAVLLFTSRLAHRTEVIAMLSSGVSFPRIMWPYFVAATFLTGVSLVTNHYVLPKANKVRLDFEEQHIRSTFRVHDKHLLREIQPGTIAYFETFSAKEKLGYRFSLEEWQDGRLTRKLTADRARYDSVTGAWVVYDYLLRELHPHGDRIQRGFQRARPGAERSREIGRMDVAAEVERFRDERGSLLLAERVARAREEEAVDLGAVEAGQTVDRGRDRHRHGVLVVVGDRLLGSAVLRGAPLDQRERKARRGNVGAVGTDSGHRETLLGSIVRAIGLTSPGCARESAARGCGRHSRCPPHKHLKMSALATRAAHARPGAAGGEESQGDDTQGSDREGDRPAAHVDPGCRHPPGDAPSSTPTQAGVGAARLRRPPGSARHHTAPPAYPGEDHRAALPTAP